MMTYQRCKKVYAVESLPPFIDALTKTFQGVDNAEIIPRAFSDKVGSAYISDNAGSSVVSNHQDGFQISLDTIDNQFYKQNRPFTFLKADVEGHAAKLLKGATKSLKEMAPKISIACYHYPKEAEEVEAVITAANPNYSFYKYGLYYTGAPKMLYASVN